MTLLSLTRLYRSGHAPVEALEACQADRDNKRAFLRRRNLVELASFPADDSGGSSNLCNCPGIDTGEHREGCPRA